MKSEEELKTLARGIASGQVYTDRHIKESRDLPMVFMVLCFMDEELQKEFAEEDIGLLYEYLDKAGPVSCNGMPSFFSLQTLTKGETTMLFEQVRKFEEYWKADDPIR